MSSSRLFEALVSTTMPYRPQAPAAARGVLPILRLPAAREPRRWACPNLEARRGVDPTWSGTLDTLRALPEDGQKGVEWRRTWPITG